MAEVQRAEFKPPHESGAFLAGLGFPALQRAWSCRRFKEIEKSLAGSGLGVTPSNDGKIIRIPLPPLTEERRKDLSKICKKHGEDTKVVVRGFRRDANEELKKLQKDAKLTEDELRKAEADTQKLTDQYVQKIDEVVKKKDLEIMEV